MAGALAGGVVGGIAGGFLGGSVAAFSDPILRAVSQFANRLTLTAIPDAHTLLALANTGLLSPNAAYRALQWHGIQLGTGGVLDDFQTGLWKATLEGHRAVPGMEALNAAWARGLINDKAWELGVVRAGGNPQTWERLLPAYYAVPTVQDLMIARNRGIITPDQFGQQLRRHGFVFPADFALIDALRLQLPTPSELIQWVVREAFDTDVVARWGYDQEVPEAARQFFEAQGLFGQYTRVGTKTGQTQTVGHLDQTWAAHWLPLSPGQAYTMLHRIRPDTVERYRSQGLNVNPFTPDDVRSWLKIADYPPGVRDYLIASAYGVNRLIDIRNALKLGVRDRAWAVGQFKSRGLHPDDAEFAADLAERQGAESKASAVRAQERNVWGQAVAAIRAAYEAGMLDRGAAVNQLVEAGLNPAAADTAANVADARAFTKLVQSAVRAVRRDYLGGALTAAEADAALATAGMQPNPRQRMLNAWSVELGHARRVASTQQVRDWYLEGLMALEEAQRRLRNLGWAEPDVQLHLTSFALKGAEARAKRAAAAQQSQRAQAAQLEKLQKQLAAEQEKVRSTLRRLSPTSKLIVWYVKGIITEQFFRSRMMSMGYDLGSTNQHFAEAQKRKEEYEAAQEKLREAQEAKAAGP